MTKIVTLTPEQTAKLPLYRDKWLRIGLSTDPTDRETAERSIDLTYHAAGLMLPQQKIWFRSPLEGCVNAYKLIQTDKVQVRNQVDAQVEKQVWDQVWKRVRDQVKKQLWDQVENWVWDQVGYLVENQVEDQTQQNSGLVYTYSYGLHEAGCLSFYDFFYKETEIKGLDVLEGLWLLAQSCGWWWAFTDAVILTEKPVFLSRDLDNRLHHEDKAAIAYSDGWGVYCWHGVVVPEWVIKNPESITVEKIDSEQNQEIKRVLLERFGEGRYLDESEVELLSED